MIQEDCFRYIWVAQLMGLFWGFVFTWISIILFFIVNKFLGKNEKKK